MATSFGVSSTGGYGYLQTVNTATNAEIASVRDTDGKIVEEKAYSRAKEVSFEAVLNGETLAEAGASLTVGDLTGLITTIAVAESATDFQRVSATIRKTDAATQTQYSS